MRIVVAPDSFKESMSAEQACIAMERGILAVFPEAEVIKVPMADGGEGTVDAVTAGLKGRLVQTSVTDLSGQLRSGQFGIAGDLGVIEVAEAVGIGLVQADARNVWTATSLGVSDLIKAATANGAKRVVIGLGGTGTNDCGAGFLVGLGARLLDFDGHEVEPRLENLHQVVSVDLSGISLPKDAQMTLACDVTNPLLGENGASAIFGPQKGLKRQDIQKADEAIRIFADALERAIGKEIRNTPGAGAAGGLGAAFLALGARMQSGVQTVAEIVGLQQAVTGADLVFTGEGAMDGQTLQGKTPAGVANIAREEGIPVIGFAGKVSPEADILLEHGFAAVVPIMRGVSSLETALKDGAQNLEAAVRTAMLLMRMGVAQNDASR